MAVPFRAAYVFRDLWLAASCGAIGRHRLPKHHRQNDLAVIRGPAPGGKRSLWAFRDRARPAWPSLHPRGPDDGVAVDTSNGDQNIFARSRARQHFRHDHHLPVVTPCEDVEQAGQVCSRSPCRSITLPRTSVIPTASSTSFTSSPTPPHAGSHRSRHHFLHGILVRVGPHRDVSVFAGPLCSSEVW